MPGAIKLQMLRHSIVVGTAAFLGRAQGSFRSSWNFTQSYRAILFNLNKRRRTPYFANNEGTSRWVAAEARQSHQCSAPLEYEAISVPEATRQQELSNIRSGAAGRTDIINQEKQDDQIVIHGVGSPHLSDSNSNNTASSMHRHTRIFTCLESPKPTKQPN